MGPHGTAQKRRRNSRRPEKGENEGDSVKSREFMLARAAPVDRSRAPPTVTYCACASKRLFTFIISTKIGSIYALIIIA